MTAKPIAITCQKCGVEVITLCLKTKYCPICRKEILSEKAKERERKKASSKKSKIPFRPLTDISEFLFCKYDFLGESVKQIAKDYERNPSQVRQVIQAAKANGKLSKAYRQVQSYGRTIIK